MGMFDNIYIHKELPLTKKQKKIFSHIEWEKQQFQTKNLENALSTYSLKKNGRLYTTQIEGEHVRVISKAEEKRLRKKHRWAWPYEFVEKSRKEVVVKYTGDLNFYDMITDIHENEWWFEFQAKIVDGSLKGKIKTIKLEINRTKKEIDDDEKEWKDRMVAYNKKPSVKLRKFMNSITYSYWSRFWDSVSRIIKKIATFLNNFGYWINRNVS